MTRHHILILVVAILITPSCTTQYDRPFGPEWEKAKTRYSENVKRLDSRTKELHSKRLAVNEKIKESGKRDFWRKLSIGQTEDDINSNFFITTIYGPAKRVNVTTERKTCYYTTPWGDGSISFDNEGRVIGWTEPDWNRPYNESFKWYSLRKSPR